MKYLPSDTPLIDQYEELRYYPEFMLLENPVLKFLMYRLDPDSPVQKVNEKNVEAAKLAGITEDEADRCMKGQSEVFNEAMTIFFRLLNNRIWEVYQSGEIALNNLLKRVRTDISTDLEEDKAIRAYDLITKCYDSSYSMTLKQEDLLNKLAGGDPEAEKILKKTVAKPSLSPAQLSRSYRKEQSGESEPEI